MDQKRWQQIEELFQQASEIAPDQRTSLLAQACDGDAELRHEVEALLRDESRIKSFLKEPAIAHVAAEFAAPSDESLSGQHIGHYQIRVRIGAGGMGEVWQAWDKNLAREVAIKILPAEFAADPERIARFQQEARAVSALHHPNIITIHEVGQVTKPDGELYFIVTEFIAGQTLRDYLLGTHASSMQHAGSVRTQGSWREDVRIATQIASALSAAHTADLIHRDIKPENIMVQANGQVKVLDFGIAKLTGLRNDETPTLSHSASPNPQSENPHSAIPNPQLTAPGARLGTIRYMSPEQTHGEVLDARTDIFSLGTVLYEMLAGQRPYGNVPDDEMMRQLMDASEIGPVSKLLPDIPAALDRIVTQALRKNRDERYASASDMLSDLQQLRINREEKGLRRLRTQSANQVLTQFVVRYDEDKTTRIPLDGLWTIGRFADLPRGKLERELLRQSRWNVLWRLGGLALGIAVVTMLMAAWASVNEVWEEKVLRDGHTAAVRRTVFSPDGRLLVSVGEDKQVIVWDFAKRERLATFNDHTDWVAAVAYSPDGKWFATASYDQTVIVWDAIKLQKEAVLRGHQNKVVSVAFSPDGKTLVSSASQPDPPDSATILWRTGSWEMFAQIPVTYAEANSPLFIPGSSRMIFHRDPKPTTANTWDVATGQPLGNQFDLGWESNNAVLSPDGALLVGVTGPGEVIFVDFKRRRLLDRFIAHQDNGRAVALSPDGRLAATGAENIILWDVVTRRKITTIDYPSIVWSAAFSPDGHWLVTTHGDGGIHVWDVTERQRAVGFNEHNGPVRAIAWAHDGKRFASAGEDRSVMIWNAASGRREMLLSGHPTRVVGVAFAPDGNTLASVDRDGLVIVWDIAERREVRQLRHQTKDGAQANCLVFSPDGRVIATSHGVYDSATGRRLSDFVGRDEWFSASALYGLAFSANGTQLATANAYGRNIVLDTATWRIIEKADFSPRQFISVSFAPNGKQLVTGEDGGIVQLWTAQPLRPTEVLGKHDARIKSVAFSPDGTQVVSAGDDKTIALWDVGRRRLVTRIGLHTSPVYAVAFAPNGQQLVSGEHDHSVRLYTRRRSLWGWRFD